MNADHRVRDGLADLIGLADGIDVVATTGHPSTALAATRDLGPDIVVVDPRLPTVGDGLTLMSGLRAVRPTVRILVLWSPECGDPADFDICADGSLDTCVDATTFSDELIAAIRATAAAPLPRAARVAEARS